MVNPLAVVAVQARHALIDPHAPTALSAAGPAPPALALLITGAVLVGGLLLYRWKGRELAERI